MKLNKNYNEEKYKETLTKAINVATDFAKFNDYCYALISIDYHVYFVLLPDNSLLNIITINSQSSITTVSTGLELFNLVKEKYNEKTKY